MEIFNRGSTRIVKFGHQNNYSAKLCITTIVPRLLYTLLIATSEDHWVPRVLFVHLIN